MDIPGAIDLNKTLLARIIAGLFALLGGVGEAALARIPREVHRRIARVLRPAESAVRRLIVVFAGTNRVKVPPARPRPMLAGLVRAGQGEPRLSFQLFDPRQRFFRQRKAAPRSQPRIRFLGQSFFGDDQFRTISPNRAPLPQKDKADGLENSAHLLRRLQALKAALDDLPGQAKRLARALARRRNVPQLRLKMPLRPGRAPGYRKRPVQDIDHILHDCDQLARNVPVPDTS